MTPEDVLREFDRVGAIEKDGHFVLSSGLHSSHYIHKDLVLAHTALADDLCRELAERYRGCGIGVVVGPASMGILVAQGIARHLTIMEGRDILSVLADKAPGGQYVIRRISEPLVAGKDALIAEDIVATGNAAEKVKAAIRRCGGTPVGVAALCSRGGVYGMDDLRWFKVLATPLYPAWAADDCPLCKLNVPISGKFSLNPPAP